MFPYALIFGMALFLVLAVWFDHRARRIPNVLVLAGMACAVLLNARLFFEDGRGLAVSLLGLLAGFALFLPLYLLKGVGAGDVKLVAMVGAFVGYRDILGTALAVLVAGGILAIVRMIVAGSARQVVANLRLIVLSWQARAQSLPGPDFVASRDSADRMPYAYAVMIGALGYQWLHHAGA